jgi:hypothetical protein
LSCSKRGDAESGAATLILVPCRESEETDRRLARIAETWGVRVVALDSEVIGAVPDLQDRIRSERVSLAGSAYALAKLEWQQPGILSNFSSALVYGFDGSARTNELLSRITGSPDAKTVELEDSEHGVTFSSNLPEECEPLRSLDLRLEKSRTRWKGLSGQCGTAQIKIGQLPLLARFERGPATVFLLAGDQLLDVGGPRNRIGRKRRVLPSSRALADLSPRSVWRMVLAQSVPAGRMDHR